MACIKSAQRAALTSLAPEAPYLAAGTMSGAVDMLFSASANIEIFGLDFQSDSPDLPLLASAPSPDRFNRLSWSRPGAAEGDSFSLGLLAGGLSDGSVAVWNPLSMISSEGQAEDAMVARLEKHTGPVCGLEFSELTPNRLASGADEGELCIWDLKNPCEPVVYPPLKKGGSRLSSTFNNDIIRTLDLSPIQEVLGDLNSLTAAQSRNLLDRTVGFTINYEREDPYDMRVLSEFPDIRLWFVRLDASYPWFPVVLDWRAGELARYAAMLVPHQISTRLGVVFNPEALELFVMKKVFVVYSWLKQQDHPKPGLKTADMARMLGFGIGDELFDLIEKYPVGPS